MGKKKALSLKILCFENDIVVNIKAEYKPSSLFTEVSLLPWKSTITSNIQ